MGMGMNGDAEREKNCLHYFWQEEGGRSWWVRMVVADQYATCKACSLHTFPTLQIPRLSSRTPPNKLTTSTTSTTTVHPTTPGEVAQVTTDLF